MHLKVGFVTCDNASNNDTMMVEFARLIELSNPGDSYDPIAYCIRYVL
jgi:hypothetical protein